jgi:hypothetical protein
MRRILALACLLLLSLPLGGCWVIDELDSGKKLMDDHSAKPKKGQAEEEATAAKAAKSGKSGRRLDAYFTAEEQAGTVKSFAPGQVSEGIVACKVGGATQFMKREECAARGGSVSP